MIRAKLFWIEKECGGRIPPPIGTRYSPLFSIEKMKGAWSADFICTELKDNEMVIEMGFLSEDAPIGTLKKGCMFELFEGRKKVATGEIL